MVRPDEVPAALDGAPAADLLLIAWPCAPAPPPIPADPLLALLGPKSSLPGGSLLLAALIALGLPVCPAMFAS